MDAILIIIFYFILSLILIIGTIAYIIYTILFLIVSIDNLILYKQYAKRGLILDGMRRSSILDGMRLDALRWVRYTIILITAYIILTAILIIMAHNNIQIFSN